MDKMRQEFEAWCREHGYTLRPAETNCGVRIDGAYGHRQVQLAWEAWQASRAALRVELPEDECGGRGYFFEDGFASGYNTCLSETKQALDQAGVSHK